MSGPKISIYELSAWQRRNLQEQLKCNQQSINCVEQIKQLIGYLNGFGEQIESILNTLSLADKRADDCSVEINELRSIQMSLEQENSSFISELSANTPIQTDKIMLDEDVLKEKKNSLNKLKAIQVDVTSYQKKIEQTLAKMNVKTQSYIKEIKRSIADDIAAASSFIIEPEESEEQQFENSQRKLESQLHSLLISDECPANIKPKIQETLLSLAKINNIHYLNTFNSVTVKPLLKEYNELLVQQITMQVEQTYINDCVNEAMSEMGYDLIGNRSVTKRNGKQFKNELFSYSDGTAINVTYDSEGQIAIELGGVDKTDRIPTSDETEALCEDMESFCTDFKIFEEKLKSKGVSIKTRISMSPPTAEHATIINVEDYNITTIKPVANIAIKNKRKKSVAKQTLRKEVN
jgi:K+/H+ antiporter YhaU regulatory subunit KhtT